MSGGNALAVALSVAAGLAGPVQIAVMGKLGDRVGTIEAVAFAAMLTGLITAAVLLVARQSLAGYADAARQPRWLWIGAAMSALIVFAITVSGPRIGTTATIAVVIAGNLVMGALIDRFGLFGLERIPLSWPRVIGLVLLALGAALTLRR
ncbi:MAG: DMT family transporter [Actinomycetota bacterium]|nr:DMT family transporter [Actinomycetota bacterium]